MNRNMNLLIKVAMAVFLILIILGIWIYLISDTFWDRYYSEGLSINRLEDGWTYQTNLDSQPIETSLPTMLPLELGTDTVRLYNKIPDDTAAGSVLRFGALLQVVHIYIDGELRAQYGDLSASDYYYPYLTAAHYVSVTLTEKDPGCDLEIVVEAPDEYLNEFRQIQHVEIANRRDFLVRNLLTDGSSLIFSALSILLSILLFFVALATWKRNIPSKLLFIFSVYILLWAAYYTTDNAIFWDLTSYSPRNSAFNDWRFYVLDAFLPVFSYYVLFSCYPFSLKRWQTRLIKLHITFFVLAGLCAISGLISIQYFCVYLKNAALLIYLILIFQTLEQRKTCKQKTFANIVFILMFCYFADYIRYNLSLRPAFSGLYNILQIHIPFLFTLGLGLAVCCVLVLVGVLELFHQEVLFYGNKTATVLQQLKYNEFQYEQVMQKVTLMKMYRHDMMYHFHILHAFAQAEDYSALDAYLRKIQNDIRETSFTRWCQSTLCSNILDWYKTEAEKYDIRFSCHADIPPELPDARVELCAVLSNILQNALEACQNADVESAFICFTATTSSKTLYLRAENSFDGKLTYHEGRLKSSKKGQGHGIGFESITSIVNKYKGVLQTSHSSRTFIVDIILNNIIA